MKGNAFIYFSLLAVWLKSYLVQRFLFGLSVTGWKQEMIVLINPAANVLLLFVAAMLFMGNRMNRAVLWIAVGTSALLYVDLIFFRFFNDFLTLPLLLQSEHLASLWGSILHLTQAGDVLIFSDSLLVGAIVYWTRHSIVPWNKVQMAAAVCTAALIMFANYSLAENIRPELLTRTFDRPMMVKYIGAFNYHIYDAVINIRMGTRKAMAQPDDFEAVSRFFSTLPSDGTDPSLFGIARGRNVFLVSLESLQSFVIERRVEGREITPFLNRLIEKSFYFDRFYHQTGQGKTSDAEFLIDTSLYPLPTGAVYFTHAQNTFYSLPNIVKEHGYYPVTFHANDPSFWNRARMYQTMGYERFYSVRDYDILPENMIGWGLNDISFFEQSVEMAGRLPKPFFAKLITLTNHYPFELDEANRKIPQFTSNSKTLNRYIPTVHYLDSALEHFFEEVKKANLYENSIFILYGDHYGISQRHNKAMAKLLEKDQIAPYDSVLLQKVPFLIHIPGVEGQRMHTVSGQIDIYPTLLHLLGIHLPERLYFGTDLFFPERRQFVVLRDGSFVTDRWIYTKNACYESETGKKVEMSVCEPYKEAAAKQLTFSDNMVYGDLFRFLLEPPRKL